MNTSLPQRARKPAPPNASRRPQPATRRENKRYAVPAPRAGAGSARAVPPAPKHGPVPPNKPEPQSVNKPLWGLSNKTWLIVAVLGVLSVMAFLCMSVTLGLGTLYGRGILPGVHVAGVDLGGLSRGEANSRLSESLSTIALRDGEKNWRVDPASLGMVVDVNATVERAYEQGRGQGSLFSTMGGVDLSPVMTIDSHALTAGLESAAPQVETSARDAGITLANGVVQAAPPVYGRRLDVMATANLVLAQADVMLARGAIDLVMVDVVPQVLDASPMVAAATALLSQPLEILAHDPVTDDSVTWELPPAAWANWLTMIANPASSQGWSLAVQDAPVRDFLATQAETFDATRYLDLDEAITTIQQAVMARDLQPVIRVYHNDSQHVVQAGETITSIAWDYGVPYLFIEEANPGVSTLSVGQTITIPSPDNFLEFPVIHNKRIVVSISQQRTWVYENGQLKWEWATSTGINSSPTWPGIYQVISHVPNAYAANWNLYMPNFMGVYRPIPGADFTNGFHGFPTRGGGQILWENSLGTRVTYGCILLSNTNAQLLYDWAEEGVVVEIQA